MTRLRSYAATARQVRVRRIAATALRHAQGRPEPRRGTAWRATVVALTLMTFGSTDVLACPVCFGAEETSMVDATKLGILALLVITVAVQGAFLAFFLYLRRRAKRIADIDLENEWSELQGASRT